MRVEVQCTEGSRGFVFRKPEFTVHYTITFSHEELAIIEMRKLHDWIVWKIEGHDTNVIDGTPMDAADTIGWIVKSPQRRIKFRTLIQATNFERALKEQHLPALKQFLERNADLPPRKDTYEI